jgi:hypothetical protein
VGARTPRKARPGDLKRFAGDWQPWAYCPARTRAGLETALSRLRCERIYLDAGLLAGFPAYFPEPGPVAPPLQPAAKSVTPKTAEV